ncbi:MAG TPA: hypothetical protein VKY36_06795, partial [Moheibacter sp.]|nr:hypothetical protein [Moheibacter sp.]
MNKYLKLILAAILIGGAVYLMSEREYGWGFVLIFLSLIPVLLFFRNEFILISFWHMRKQNIEKAKIWLNKIT